MWDAALSRKDVTFLARGEYSFNYRVKGVKCDLVARLITGTQIGLPLQEQVLYEYEALQALAASGVTPKPFFVDPNPQRLPYGLIMEEYLPGCPLDYSKDLVAAARCVATIHEIGVPEQHHLQVHAEPAESILEESREWSASYLEWGGASPESQSLLIAAFEKTARLLERKGLFTQEDLAIVNYDLNTHNFLVNQGEAKLVDWEKARIAPRTQDIAHFLLPTTTLWRDETATLLSRDQESEFLDAYLSASQVTDKERFMVQLEVMRFLISLRAVSWCAWALEASASGSRAIVNEETLNKSRTYLEPDFLRRLFGA